MPWFAGSIGASNVAFRGITPALATAIQAVTKVGVDAGQIGVTHTTDLLLGWGVPVTQPQGARYGPPRSTSDATLQTCSGTRSLLCGPALDLRAEPELDSAVAEVNDGTWHVVIPALIEADAVAVRQPKRICDRLRVHQVFRGYEWGHRF